MNTERNGDHEEIPDDILEQAAIWQAQLKDAHGDGLESGKVRAAFSTWLLADPRHRQAFDEMQSLWGALEEPVANLAQAPRTASHARSWRGFFATAACLVLAVVLGLGWQQDWPPRWHADVVTSVGERTTLELNDGSSVALNTRSALAVDFTPEQRRVSLLAGEAWFDVAKDETRPFIVDIGQGHVKVTGTRFNVRLEDGEALVSLVEGRLQLTNDTTGGAEPVVLSPGQQARLAAGGISTPVAFDKTAVTAWQRGQFVFYNEPLARVVANLNRHRQGHILITDDSLNRLKVTGVFSTSEPDTALEVITNTLPVEQIRLTDYLVLLR
ncbi:FecR family protein [Vreelandella alkaliphila]|uniref:FecR family protein n=1 Tax=Vreelandella alkaliphila TaxID=272774 RepID=UPI003F9B66E1